MAGWKEQLAQAQAMARSNYQDIIDYIKDQIGAGIEYENDLVKVVLSKRGCYYEFQDIPEEFSGAVGSGYLYEFVDGNDGLELLGNIEKMLHDHTQANTRELRLMLLYNTNPVSLDDETYVYQFQQIQGEIQELELGKFNASRLPHFAKLKVDSDLAIPVLGTRKGLIFFIANMTDRHLLVLIPHNELTTADLAELAINKTVN